MRYTTTIPIDNVHRAPVFTNSGIAWLERNKAEYTLLYYDFLTSKLPKSITTVLSNAIDQYWYDRLGVDINTNTFCIGVRQKETWQYTNIPLNNIKSASTIDIPLIQGGTELYDVVYDALKHRFTAIYENRNHRFIILKPIAHNTKEEDTIYPRQSLDSNISCNIEHLWKAFGRYFLRFNEYREIKHSMLLIYDTIDKKIVFEDGYNTYAHSDTKPLDEIERYGYAIDTGMVNGLVSETRELATIKQCITPHILIPNYNSLISKRATAESVKNRLKTWPSDFGFDAVQLCYVTDQRNNLGKDNLLVYSLLPHSTKNAIREISEDKNMEDRVLQAWYTVHASLKTAQWKNLERKTKNKIDPRISKLLPFYQQAPQGSLAQISDLFRRNLGMLQQKTNYFRYVYGRTVKNMALAVGVAAVALYALSKTGSYVMRQISTDKPSLPRGMYNNYTYTSIIINRDFFIKNAGKIQYQLPNQ